MFYPLNYSHIQCGGKSVWLGSGQYFLETIFFWYLEVSTRWDQNLMLICKSTAFSSVFRLLPSSIRQKNPSFSTVLSPAEKYYTHLQKYGNNIEKSLPTVGDKINSSCVNEVLNRCSLNQSQQCLRFFIWAGVQSYYRHSSYIYSKACELFRINQNPSAIMDVIEAYRVEGSVVTVKTFHVILNLCREAKLVDEALRVLRKMTEFNMRADTIAYNTVIRLFCENGNMDLAVELMKEMGLSDLYPNMITYVTMIKGFCNVGRLEEACELLKVMKRHGCSPNTVVYSVILDGVCRFGSLERALKLLGEMEKDGDFSANVITYTSIIQDCCEKGKLIEATKILDRMRACGCAPNRVTVSVLMKSLCAERRIEEAYKLIDGVVAGGSVSYGECYSSLVVSLVGSNNLQEAEKLFRRMLANAVKPDGLSCSTLMKALLCMEDRFLNVFHLLDELDKMKVLSSIDSDIYSILLVGLSQKGHSVEAMKLARLMIDRRIPLKTPYYKSVVEYLTKSGDKEMLLHLCSTSFDRQ